MDQWLNDGPGLAYVKELCTWIVVSNKGELISWTDDPAEIAWLSLWVLQYKATVKEADEGPVNRSSKAVGLGNSDADNGRSVTCTPIFVRCCLPSR